MKTKNDIKYQVGFFKTTIPAGTTLIPATNLPEYEERELYWAEPWEGMTESETGFTRNYGFLISGKEEELV